MAVPLDLASPSDLPRASALRPLVQGVAGDEKHDPIRKIYVRADLDLSVGLNLRSRPLFWLPPHSGCTVSGSACTFVLQIPISQGPSLENTLLFTL